ncbi:MAG: hypothetical protein RJQ09_21175 [Cyclobacteriaceae bacterium]
MKIKGTIYVLMFLLIFVFTQDYLFLSWSDSPSVLGFPDWLPYFIGLHIALAIIFHVFQKRYWK